MKVNVLIVRINSNSWGVRFCWSINRFRMESRCLDCKIIRPNIRGALFELFRAVYIGYFVYTYFFSYTYLYHHYYQFPFTKLLWYTDIDITSLSLSFILNPYNIQFIWYLSYFSQLMWYPIPNINIKQMIDNGTSLPQDYKIIIIFFCSCKVKQSKCCSWLCVGSGWRLRSLPMRRCGTSQWLSFDYVRNCLARSDIFTGLLRLKTTCTGLRWWSQGADPSLLGFFPSMVSTRFRSAFSGLSLFSFCLNC